MDSPSFLCTKLRPGTRHLLGWGHPPHLWGNRTEACRGRRPGAMQLRCGPEGSRAGALGCRHGWGPPWHSQCPPPKGAAAGTGGVSVLTPPSHAASAAALGCAWNSEAELQSPLAQHLWAPGQAPCLSFSMCCYLRDPTGREGVASATAPPGRAVRGAGAHPPESRAT